MSIGLLGPAWLLTAFLWALAVLGAAVLVTFLVCILLITAHARSMARNLSDIANLLYSEREFLAKLRAPTQPPQRPT